MKKLFLILFFLLFGLNGLFKIQAQENPNNFSKLYRYIDNDFACAFDCLEYDSIGNSLFTVLGSFLPVNNRTKLISTYYKLDTEGNIIKTLDDSGGAYHTRYHIIRMSFDNQAVFWSGYKDEIGKDTFQIAILIKTDKDLNVLWRKEFDFQEALSRYNDLIEDPKTKSIYLLSYRGTPLESRHPTQYPQVYIQKLDSLGNFIKEDTFSLGYSTSGTSMVRTPEGGFIISGRAFGRNNSQLPYPSGTLFSIKVDTGGNMLWHKFYETDHKPAYLMRNISLNNGYYINAGEKKENSNARSSALINCIDEVGNTIWTTKFKEESDVDPSLGGGIWGASRMPDNQFVISGATFSDLYDSLARGWLVKLNEDGEVLWSKILSHHFPNINEYLYHVVTLKDGSIVASGWTGDRSTVGNYFVQAGWLVRIDSSGSFAIPGQGVALQSGDLKVYPNPSRGKISLKADVPFPTQSSIRLLDAKGRYLETLKVVEGKAEQAYDLSHYAAGVYFLEIRWGDKERKMEKIVIND